MTATPSGIITTPSHDHPLSISPFPARKHHTLAARHFACRTEVEDIRPFSLFAAKAAAPFRPRLLHKHSDFTIVIARPTSSSNASHPTESPKASLEGSCSRTPLAHFLQKQIFVRRSQTRDQLQFPESAERSVNSPLAPTDRGDEYHHIFSVD
jgi:hypothetical protein